MSLNLWWVSDTNVAHPIRMLFYYNVSQGIGGGDMWGCSG